MGAEERETGLFPSQIVLRSNGKIYIGKKNIKIKKTRKFYKKHKTTCKTKGLKSVSRTN